MNLQEQCCTREQGARLVELGVKPLATFYHMPAKDGPHGEYIQYGWHGDNLAPAFTVSELGDMLPERFIIYKSSDKYDTAKGVFYISSQRQGECARIYGTSEAEVRAAQLILLLENNNNELPEHWREDPANACHGGRCKRPYSPDIKEIRPLPRPSYHEREMPVFNAVWKVLKGCYISMPLYYNGYQEVNGCHVKLITDAIEGKYDDNTLPGV